MPRRSTFGDRLCELREDAGVSQKELARLLGVGNTSISSYENNKRKPSHEVIEKIAQHFNVSYDYLMGNGEKRPNPYPSAKRIFAPYEKTVYTEESLNEMLFNLDAAEKKSVIAYVHIITSQSTLSANKIIGIIKNIVDTICDE